mmetsp:Transcript_33030/g.85492  ORF Transcript_33030/g.85492 Transcript_33030/m.85492 type:complete len:89 (-) Transcript_33030:202-468(-)
MLWLNMEARATASMEHARVARKIKKMKAILLPTSGLSGTQRMKITENNNEHKTLSAHTSKVWQRWYKNGEPTWDSNSCMMLRLLWLNS